MATRTNGLSHLENRPQMCSVKGSLYKIFSSSCGVPQGTILGPLLFLLNINDLYQIVRWIDTHLTYAGKNADNIQFRLNQDLENVHNWPESKQMYYKYAGL